jgi:hypothetical protein
MGGMRLAGGKPQFRGPTARVQEGWSSFDCMVLAYASVNAHKAPIEDGRESLSACFLQCQISLPTVETVVWNVLRHFLLAGNANFLS